MPEPDKTNDDLNIEITNEGEFIKLHFGKSLSWVGFTPSQARGIAQMLLKRANEIDPPAV